MFFTKSKAEFNIFSSRGKSNSHSKKTLDKIKINEALYYVQNLHDKELAYMS